MATLVEDIADGLLKLEHGDDVVQVGSRCGNMGEFTQIISASTFRRKHCLLSWSRKCLSPLRVRRLEIEKSDETELIFADWDACVLPILPHSWENIASIDGWAQFTQNDSVQSAVNQCDEYVELLTLGKNDELQLVFPASETQSIETALPILNVYLEHIHRFFAIEILVLTTEGERRLRYTNKSTTVRITPEDAVIPVVPIEGWNRLQIDLLHAVQRLWPGSTLDRTISVALMPNCRLKRVFFSDRIRDNHELPPSLVASS